MKTKSLAIAAVIVIGVVAVPLWLKSNSESPTVSTRPPASRVSSTSATEARAPAASRGSSASTTEARAPAPSPKPLPKFVELGTTTCAPCKAMLGVMAELEEKYPYAMEIEFVNVREQRDDARRYGIRAIPTQIFYAPGGRELYRHIGVFRAKQVIAKWAELGYPMQPSRER